MQVAYDILYFWLPAGSAITALFWVVVLSSHTRGVWQNLFHGLVVAAVFCLAGWSLLALIGMRFQDWWPSYLPYIFVPAALAIIGTWHFVLRRVGA